MLYTCGVHRPLEDVHTQHQPEQTAAYVLREKGNIAELFTKRELTYLQMYFAPFYVLLLGKRGCHELS